MSSLSIGAWVHHLPVPNRIFIGGSGGNLSQILDTCLATGGLGAGSGYLGTSQHTALGWLNEARQMELPVVASAAIRSPVGSGPNPFAPLNPVTIHGNPRLSSDIEGRVGITPLEQPEHGSSCW